MRHPFDGINQPENTTRRSWLQGFFAALAGLFATRTAQAVAPPRGVKLQVEPNPEPGTTPKPTTKALREEGALTRAGKEAGRVTTLAVGEEGAATRAIGEAGGGRISTRALNEEGAATTKAVGEEGGVKPVRPPVATTLALGEEGARK